MKHLLPFLLLLASFAAMAESGAYRIEVIVFRNLNVVTGTAPDTDRATGLDQVEGLHSFSHLPEIEKPAPPEELPDDPVLEGEWSSPDMYIMLEKPRDAPTFPNPIIK